MRRPLTYEWRDHYIKRLKGMGIEQLGNGFCANVFQHPTMPDIAVKVVEATDRQFFKFLHWSKRHYWNSWVPKFYDVTMVDVVNNKGYGIIFLERLEKIGDAEFQLFLEDTLFCTKKSLTVTCLERAVNMVHDDDLRSVLHFILVRSKGMDLHQGNFMKRGEQIVFVDPVYGP